MPIEISNPASVGKPGHLYSIMTRVRTGSELIYICGMAGNAGETKETPAAEVFEMQINKVYRQIGDALASVGASYSNIVQFTTHLVHREDIPRYVEWRKREYPKMFPSKVYPPNVLTLVELMDPSWRVEIQTVAAL